MTVDERELRQIELIGVLDPGVIERARRLSAAIQMLRDGLPAAEVRMTLRQRYRISQTRAWFLVDMAIDLAGPV